MTPGERRPRGVVLRGCPARPDAGRGRRRWDDGLSRGAGGGRPTGTGRRGTWIDAPGASGGRHRSQPVGRAWSAGPGREGQKKEATERRKVTRRYGRVVSRTGPSAWDSRGKDSRLSLYRLRPAGIQGCPAGGSRDNETPTQRPAPPRSLRRTLGLFTHFCNTCYGVFIPQQVGVRVNIFRTDRLCVPPHGVSIRIRLRFFACRRAMRPHPTPAGRPTPIT